MQNVFLDIFRTMANFDARQGGSSYREVRYVGRHMSDNLKVICEKPKLPTLWLDTSVIIKLTKVERRKIAAG